MNARDRVIGEEFLPPTNVENALLFRSSMCEDLALTHRTQTCTDEKIDRSTNDNDLRNATSALTDKNICMYFFRLLGKNTENIR